MAGDRVYNFSAGPSQLPVEVLESMQGEMLNYQGSGMSVMEMSHRSKEFVAIFDQAMHDVKELLNVPDSHKIMFFQGGATLQFASIPLNFFGGGKTNADYAVTGQWGEKAFKEAAKYGTANAACNTKSEKFNRVPPVAEWKLSDPATTAYLHYCDNETVNGVEFAATPVLDDAYKPVPLVADMSSNFLTRPVDVARHTLIYAGLQKNAGPAGTAVTIIDGDYVGKELPICPTYCSYKAQLDAGGMYNTPACYTIYAMGRYLKYTKEKGGLSYWAELSDKKSTMIYDIIDGSDGFFSCPVQKGSRSRVNLPFQIKGGDEALEKKFLEEAKKQKMVTLAGHRTVGGIRASLYNGMPMEGVHALADFMKSFMDENAA